MVGRFDIFLVTAILATAISTGCSATRTVAMAPMAALLPARNDVRAETARQWNDWADAHLQNGDIVFMRGDCYMLMRTVNFSELSTDLTDSRFSHNGLVAIEDGRAYVYDIRNKGCIRTRFGDMLADRQLHQVAVKRLRDASPESLVLTAAFCRSVFEKHAQFDSQFKLNNDRFYCTELVEEAYRSTGYRLSEPVAIQDLPNYSRHARTIRLARAVTHIEPDQPVLLPGNEQFGIWANPELELILDLPNTKVGPPSL